MGSQMFSVRHSDHMLGRLVGSGVVGRARPKGAVLVAVGAVLAATLSAVVGPVEEASASLTAPGVQTYPLQADSFITKPDGEKPVIWVDLTLQAGESRKLVGEVNATMITTGNDMDDTVGINCHVRDTGVWAGTGAYAEEGIVPGETKTLRPVMLFTPTTAGVYRCQLVAATGTEGAFMTLHKDLTFLTVSAADEVGSHMWQNPPCDSAGTLLSCTYLGEPGGPTQKLLLDNDGSAPYKWAAADSATAIGVTANVELTECGHTASCGGREHDGTNATVSSHVEAIQLDALGFTCKVNRSSERTDIIGIFNHHYNIEYSLPNVPVLATCGGSRNFRVHVVMKWISGNSVKIDGSRPDPLTATNAVAVNSVYASSAVAVPSVIGLGQAAAQNALTAAHLAGKAFFVPSSQPAGTVVNQNAPAATVEPINSPVNISVSRLNVNPVPDSTTLMGTTFTRTLTANNGTSPVTWTATNLPPGLSLTPSTGLIFGPLTQAGVYQIAYTATAAGQTSSGSFTVTVTVAVPNLFGLSPAQATSALNGTGLIVGTVGSVPTDDADLAGNVVIQSTAAGTPVPTGTVVSFALGDFTPNGCGPDPC
jgi:hypothetical protein